MKKNTDNTCWNMEKMQKVVLEKMKLNCLNPIRIMNPLKKVHKQREFVYVIFAFVHF